MEGPRGTAEIFEVTLPDTGPTIEVAYAVVFGGERTVCDSLGEAHLLTKERAGVS